MALNPKEKEHCRLLDLKETEWEAIVNAIKDQTYEKSPNPIYNFLYIFPLRKVVNRFNLQSSIASWYMIILTIVMIFLVALQLQLLRVAK